MSSDAIRNFEVARARLGYAAAVLHTIDLDGLASVHERLASPQALVDGISFATQLSAEDWLAVIQTARAFRDTTPFDEDAVAFVAANIPAQLRSLKPPHFEPGDDLVGEDFACPGCGERRVDELQLNDETASCSTCDLEYNLPEVGR